MTVLAHVGHLLVDLPIFLGPVLLLVAWLLLNVHKDRSRGKDRATRRDV